MDKITKYYELIQSLDSREWQALENYLICFGTNNSAKNKVLVLARALRESKECMTPLTYSMKVYREKKLRALKQLALRLKYRAFEIMTSEHALEDEEGLVNDADFVLVRIKRLCAAYQRLLHTKPNIGFRQDLLEEIILLAKEYERYDILLEHLHLKKWHCRVQKERKQFEKVKKEIEYYEQCRLHLITAADYLHDLKGIEEYSGKRNDARIISFFEKAIPQLQYLYALTPCPYILYYLRFLEMSQLMFNKQYRKARSKALDLLDIIRKNKSVYKKQRVGIVFDMMVLCDLNIGNFEQALEQSRRSLECFPAGHYNHAISRQYEFYSLFYGKMYDEAESCAIEMIKLGRDHAGDFRYDKFHYLHACALFKMKRYEEALRSLRFKTEIREDKDGWEFSWRVLQIMCTVELGKDDKARKMIKTLSQFILNNKKKNTFSLRQKTIMSMLFLFDKMGFDFSRIYDQPKAHSLHDKLTNTDDEYRWKMLSSEVIPFNEWFRENLHVRSDKKSLIYS